MPRISEIALIAQAAQPVMSIRTHTSIEKLPQLIGESYGRIVTHLQSCSKLMSDVPFVLYHNLDMQNLDVEMGFPVIAELPEQDDIRCRTVPAGKAVMCMYIGDYAQMGPVYEEMTQWIKDHGFEGEGTAYEYYYNGPGFPIEQMLTKIVLPLK